MPFKFVLNSVWTKLLNPVNLHLNFNDDRRMAVTRLERKGQKNVSRAKARVQTIKRLRAAPVIKNVDIEAIKAEFAKKKSGKAEKKVEAKVEEVKAVEVEETPKVEEKKKAAPKAKKEETAPKTEKKAAAPKAEKKEAAPKAEKQAPAKKKAPAKKPASKKH